MARGGGPSGSPPSHGGEKLPAPALDEIADLRVDHLAELASAEDTVVTDVLGQQVFALLGRNLGTEDVSGFGLAVAGDVVELTLDGHQCGAANRGRLHQRAAHPPVAFGQGE